jgi:hypothetical protein
MTAAMPMAARKPLHPLLVLVIAILLPGMGQVLNRAPMRGLTMVFFMIVLGIATTHVAPPDRSFIGQHAGGFFIYAVSIIDAYVWARYSRAYFQQAKAAPAALDEPAIS